MADADSPRKKIIFLCWSALAGIAFGLIATVFRWNGLNLRPGNPAAPGFWEQVVSSWPLYLGSILAVAAILAGLIRPARGRRTFVVALAAALIMMTGLAIDFVAHSVKDDWLIGHILWYSGIFVTSGALFAALLGSVDDERDEESDADQLQRGVG